MAESKSKKNQKMPDGFVDDLDSMLNLDETSQQQVGLIDDDDAIDRLLVGDVFPEDGESDDDEGLTDIDQLISEGAGKDDSLSVDIDEFGDDVDDIISGIPINPKPMNVAGKDDISPVDRVEVDDNIELGALERVAEIDEFSDDAPPALSDFKIKPGHLKDELDTMVEIDEFSDEPGHFSHENADFLLADFDISADDHEGITRERVIAAEPEAKVDRVEAGLGIDSTDLDIELGNQEFVADTIDAASQMPEPAEVSDEEATQQPGIRQPVPETVKSVIDHSAALAGLGTQINDLKKQYALVKQEIHLKPNKDELNACLESIETLKAELKKNKRSLDALINKKPVAAYVANGIAGVALIVGIGFGFQGYVAKLQVAQLVEHFGKLQERINTTPAADSAEKEMLKKQLDELTQANSVMANQIAELNKSLQGGDAGKPVGDVAKHLSDLSNHDMQMGAAIEALQSKLTALEKGKVSSAPKKPAPPKQPVAQANWGVNLIAFKQDWYAKRKAEEFAAKGVPAKVIKAVSKGETWYRLVVDGFNTQYEAASYAARVKKTLNLDSVWVAKNKE